MKVMLILLLTVSGEWAYNETPVTACERLAPIVAQRLEAKEEVHRVWTACVTRYNA